MAVVPETSFGQSPSDGTSSTPSPEDHTHGSPPDPVPPHVAEADPHSQYQLKADIVAYAHGGTGAASYAEALDALDRHGSRGGILIGSGGTGGGTDPKSNEIVPTTDEWVVTARASSPNGVTFAPSKTQIWRSAADVSENAGVFKDHTLAFSVQPNKTYNFEFVVPFQTDSTTCGLGLAVSVTGGPVASIVYEREIPTTAVAGTGNNNMQQATTSDGTNTDTTSIDAANTTRLARVRGVVEGGTGAAATVRLRFRREAGATGKTATLKKGTQLVLNEAL